MLPCLVLTSDADWDLHNVQFPSHHSEEERRCTIINAIKTQQSQNELFGHLDIEPGLKGTVDDPVTFASRLISSVQRHDPNHCKDDPPVAKTFHLAKRKSTVSAEHLSERWFIGLQQAAQTIKVTTQQLLRSAILPLAWRYQAD